MGCISNETSGVGLGLIGHRDGFGTEPGMSHNSIPPSRLCLKAWAGWSMPVPRHLVPGNKRRHGGGADQDSDMPSTAALAAAIAAANNSLEDLIWQQAQAKEREEQEAKDTAVGSCRLGIRFWADIELARLAIVLTHGSSGSQKRCPLPR